jgi:hypothetical protein
MSAQHLRTQVRAAVVIMQESRLRTCDGATRKIQGSAGAEATIANIDEIPTSA